MARTTVENQTDVEIDYEGVHIIEMRDNKTVDNILFQSFTYDTEELAHELIADLTDKLYYYLKRTKNEDKARETIVALIEEIALETLNKEIIEWGA